MLLQEIGSAPLLAGPAFLKGERKRLPTTALTTKVLCARHNSMLSPLDVEALKVFRALRRFESDLKDSVSSPVDDFELISGPRFEAWIVKAFFGLLTKGILADPDGNPITRWRDGTEADLLDILFAAGKWPSDYGLWMVPPDGASAAAADLAFEALTVDGRLWAGGVELGAFMFQIALGRPGKTGAVSRPKALVVSKDGFDVQKTLALGWPDGMAGPEVVVSRVGQVDDWDHSREHRP